MLVHSLHAQSSRASSAFFELRQGDIKSTKLSIPKTFKKAPSLVLTSTRTRACGNRSFASVPALRILWLELRRLPPNQGFCEGSLLRNEPQYPMGYALHSGRGGGSNSPQCTVTPSHRAPKRLVSVVTVVKLVCCVLELR